jgi:hypothetical protein
MDGKLIRRLATAGVALMVGAAALSPLAAPKTDAAPTAVGRAASGATPADIQAAVDAFRADLGNNNGVGGSFPNGRREINWDGTPDAFSAPNALPGNFFNVNSPRGLVMTTPGSSLQLSANAVNLTNTPVRFANLNPTYENQFSVFSPQRLFTPVGSNVTDLSFFIPGTNTPAMVAGFGAVFTDVRIAGATTMEFFTNTGLSLGKFQVPASPSGGLSFLGLSFPNNPAIAGIARVRITTGTAALGPNDGGNVDVVAMDDFIYGEPRPLW